MFGDLMGKLQEAQAQMQESKKRLDDIFIDEEIEGGLVKVTVTGNKKIKNLSISQELIDDKDKEAIEDLVLTVLNRALEKAEKVNEQEMGGVAQGMMPGLTDMF